MIVTCPSCSTRYLTDPALLGAGGRTVRCAKCQHSWLQTPPPDMPRRVDVMSPLLQSVVNTPPRFNLPTRYVPPRRRRRGLKAALAAAAAAALVIGGGYFARDRIIESWPPAKRVYEMIGGLVGAPTSTLDLGKIQVVRQPSDGVDKLILSGEIINSGSEPQQVPALQATLLDANDRGLMYWTFSTDYTVLQPGEIAKFKTEALNPPKDFDRTLVTFVEGR
ncbi:MAG: DUF3426 domain-containing protein [Dongiaceae bacterium]